MGRDLAPIVYEYKGKVTRFDLIICDDQIATVCRPIETPDGTFDIEVISEGMSYDDIVENFPASAAQQRKGRDYCFIDLVRSIIFEEFLNTGRGREIGNVRNFWYTHLKFIVEDVLKLGETDSVKTTINNAWGDLVNAGTVTYEGMNIFSAKENVRHSVIRDSPFANMIVAAEKEDLFEWFRWIPQLFNCTLITAGGQPSRAVARAFIRELKNNKVDLDQDFFMCTISDLDPAGYYIQESFKAQFEKAIEFYGGHGTIAIRRLFVRKDQVTPTLLQHQAMKCEDISARSPKAKKAENTKWAYFCEQTAGGLYKEEGGRRYRAKLELNAFGKDTIERKIIIELLKIIEDTNDESLIMIPEVMRIFDLQRLEAIADILKKHKDGWLKPQVEEFLSQSKDLQRKLWSHTLSERAVASNKFKDVTDPIRKIYNERREKLDANISERTAVEEEEIDAYEVDQGFDVTRKTIERMRTILKDLENAIDDDVREACEENYDQIDKLEDISSKAHDHLDEREGKDLKPHEDAYEKVKEDIKAKDKFRKEKIQEYRRWKETLFNPVEKELERRIKRGMDPAELNVWYRDLEEDKRTRPHVALLMTEPDELIESGVSAWDQELPVFREGDLLAKGVEGQG